MADISNDKACVVLETRYEHQKVKHIINKKKGKEHCEYEDGHKTNEDRSRNKNMSRKIKQKTPPKQKNWQLHRLRPTHFPLSKGNRVKFYHDGKDYFSDVYDAISSSTEFIYIVGWSVWPGLRLKRSRKNPDKYLTLGELLKTKAKQGVKVCIHIWDETGNGVNILRSGLMRGMSTHDEYTSRYFSGTGVNVNMSRRLRRWSHHIKKSAKNLAFSHHQKCVLCDIPSAIHPPLREIVGFLGGLDLTTGRWDTNSHYLFKTLKTYHNGDYYQTLPHQIAELGPRMPWHDVAARVKGRAAIDLIKNFEERWNRQPMYAKWIPVPMIKNIPAHKLPLYIFDENNKKKFKFIEGGFGGEYDEEESSKLLKNKDWNVQILRSIDGRAVRMAKYAHKDNSILIGYLQAIRNAETFIYIENQFFMGSSEWWDQPQFGCTNPIPISIVENIREKIESGKQFKVFIVLPLFMDGKDPSRKPTQEILHWQWQTMKMMYSEINKVIVKQEKRERKNGGPTKKREPKDYLRFFCLGKIENKSDNEREDIEKEKENETGKKKKQKISKIQKRLMKSRRFQIYVHAKMMIVDDEYIIVGSANLNQRSLAGDRDTELCLGAWQPKCKNIEEGKIGIFRRNIWKEHLGAKKIKRKWLNPIKCWDDICELAEENWRIYAMEQESDVKIEMKGHLMTYPILVKENGEVEPAQETFPDFPNGSICGRDYRYFPNFISM